MNRNTKKFNVSAVETLVSTLNNDTIGAAFLVKNKFEGGKDYIAKKILLGALGQKEQEGAMMEVNLLKNL